jgi:hypothetical protein
MLIAPPGYLSGFIQIGKITPTVGIQASQPNGEYLFQVPEKIQLG